MSKLKAAFCMVLVLLLICAGLYFFIFAPDYSSGWLLSWGERAEKGGNKNRAAYFYEQSLSLNPYGTQARLRLTVLLPQPVQKHSRRRAAARGNLAAAFEHVFFTPNCPACLSGRGAWQKLLRRLTAPAAA